MPETFYVVRHGSKMSWVTDDWENPTGTPRDCPLAPVGEKHAIDLRNYFLSLPEELRPTALFSSPYYRCLQTIQPIADALDLPIYAEHGLSEYYVKAKENTGLLPRPASAQVLQKYFPQIDPSWSSVWYPSRKGETVEEVHDRVRGFLQVFASKLKQRVPPVRHKRVLFVTHGAMAVAVARELVGKLDPIRVGCCSLTELKLRKGVAEADFLGGYEPVKLASDEHLEGEALRPWGFQDIKMKDGKIIEETGELGTEDELDEPLGAAPDDT